MTIKKAKELLDIYYEIAKASEQIHRPVAWALYQVWKRADREAAKKETERSE